MAKVAENMEKAAAGRSRYVSEQTVESRTRRTDGKLVESEAREYRVFPGPETSEKKLIAVRGKIHKGEKISRYEGLDSRPSHGGIDDAIVSSLADGLVNNNESRDGIPKHLFPLGTDSLTKYTFRLVDTKPYNGRQTHHISFEPRVGDPGRATPLSTPRHCNPSRSPPTSVSGSRSLSVPCWE